MFIGIEDQNLKGFTQVSAHQGPDFLLGWYSFHSFCSINVTAQDLSCRFSFFEPPSFRPDTRSDATNQGSDTSFPTLLNRLYSPFCSHQIPRN